MRTKTLTQRIVDTELDCWTQATVQLNKLSAMLSEQQRDDPAGRVHRLLSQWPSDDSLPTEGIDGVKSIYKKLISGLNEVKTNAEKDVEYESSLYFCCRTDTHLDT